MKTITVNGEKYVSEADYKKKSGSAVPTKKRIVVLQRGWVAVGDYAEVKGEGTLTNAAIIRVWGTTKGLGEIAEGGPTSATKLDPCPPLRFHPMTVIVSIDCNESAWSGKI